MICFFCLSPSLSLSLSLSSPSLSLTPSLLLSLPLSFSPSLSLYLSPSLSPLLARIPDSESPVITRTDSNSTESTTNIPNNLTRWREECNALDGSTSFLCVAGIRSTLLNILTTNINNTKPTRVTPPSRLSPNDPLYTFLAAVARAPTPPLPETTSDHTPLTTAVVTIPSITPSSNIPSPPTTANNPLLFSVIQDRSSSQSSTVSNVTTTTTSTTAPLPIDMSSTTTPSDLATIQVIDQTNPSSQTGLTSQSIATSLIGLTSNTSSSSLTNLTSLTNHTLTTTISSSHQLPEGIDPTFLAALPDAMRHEVLAQYEREQQQQQQQQGVVPPQSSGTINPEVLAALPPDIQEEVSCYSYL